MTERSNQTRREDVASGFRLWRGGGLPHFSHQRILTAQENCLVSRQQLSTRVPSSPHNRVGTRSIPTPRRMAPSRCSGRGPQTRYNAFGNPRTPALPYPPRRQAHCTSTRWWPKRDKPDLFSPAIPPKNEDDVAPPPRELLRPLPHPVLSDRLRL